MKMYVLVRKDLPRSYQAVQGAHAVAEYLLTHETGWNNGTMVMLEVSDECMLIDQSKRLVEGNINHSVFIEPDIGDEATALACVCDGKLFSNLKLL